MGVVEGKRVSELSGKYNIKGEFSLTGPMPRVSHLFWGEMEYACIREGCGVNNLAVRGLLSATISRQVWVCGHTYSTYTVACFGRYGISTGLLGVTEMF